MVLVQSRGSFRASSLKVLERYNAFIPNPIEFIFLPSYDLAKDYGYVTPSHYGEDLYNIIIKDISGRELWLHAYIDNSEPFASQELAKLLELAGFQIPQEKKDTGNFLSVFMTWLNKDLRRIPIEPISLRRKS